ncbi:SusC/RagA family TonB-linked outer membrane protein [Thalassobellus suaedae]|uniref:TonB-dependent receptor n=1 Tax=Thalassobellus suaedae TaxID=3074124 RepID=A0ABY9Y3K8_9FLAO|nr:TonB-dependent receptor [Flavobacteriaceae bacterium HL-DH10]
MKTNKNFKYYLFLLGLILCMPMYGQNENTVKGTVSDESGIPLPGVSVIIKNTTTGTATDFDGNYTLKTSSSDILVFSYLGYTTKEISVDGKSTLDVKMAEEAGQLDEVVVIGYGSTTRRDVTGAIASVTGEKLAAVPVADAAQALQGKLPGVRVTTQDGRPGADISIRVRGGGSISQSNQPLFIVDGFPVGSISNIPGNQIKSIDVLKDASSTAIYGARGANGVIIVTTKSGVAGKTKVTYDGYTQFSTIPEYLPVMDGYDYIAYNWGYADAIGASYRDAWEKLWLIGPQAGAGNSAGIDYYKTVPSRNYTKDLYNSAFTHSHNFNISGGSEDTRYLLAVNHLDQEGNKERSFYERTNVSFRLDQNLGDKLKFSLNTRYAQTSEGNNSGNSQAYWFRPIPIENVLGDYDLTSNTQLGDYDRLILDQFSPVALLNDQDSVNKNRSVVANTSLAWDVIPGLTAKTDFSLSSNWGSQKSWSGAIASGYLDTDRNPTFGGQARVRQAQGWNYRWVNTLNYDVQGLGEDHKLGALLGYEVADSGSERVDVSGQRFPLSYDAQRAWDNMGDYLKEDGSTYFSLATSGGTPNRIQSIFSRLQYGYKGKYLFTGTFRADGSSRFAPDNRWGYFPAGAIAWRVSEEDFLKNSNWLDDLKIRFSYGAVGSDGISAELWKQSWRPTTVRWSLGDVQQPGYVPGGLLANPDLKWETTITRNLGIDFQLLGGKLSGTLELYKNTVEDLLLVTPVSPLSGFTNTQANIGSTSNKGVEFSLSADIIRSEDFNLIGSFNININRGNVEALSDDINGTYSSGFGGVYFYPREDYILTVGKPVGLLRGFIHEGMYTTDDFDYDSNNQIYTTKAGVPSYTSGVIGTIYGTTANKPSSQTEYPGVQKVRDLNGDGLIDENDITVIGDTNPDHTGGFSLGGNYKNFDFNFDFTWSVGNDIYNASRVNAYLGIKEAGLFRNRYAELNGAYKIHDVVNGQLTRIVDPAALDALNANATSFLPYPESALASTFGVEDGSYLRLNTVTLGYTLPQNVVDRFGINKFRLYGSVFNAFTITGYNGFDPEINVDETAGNSSYPTPGLDLNAYPRPRTFTFGLNIEF